MSLVDIGLLSLVEIVGDFGLKQFANYGGINNFTIGVGGYIGVIYFLIRSLQDSTILVVNNAWDGVSSLIESIAAYIVLGERFKSPREFLGVVFIILGLILLDLPVRKKHKFTWPKMW